MGIVFRQSIKSSIVIFSGAFLGAATNFIYPYVLSQSELGFFTNIIYWSAMLQGFMLLGCGAVLALRIQKYPEHDERKKVLITASSLITLFCTVLFSAGYILAKERIIGQFHPGDRELVREYFYWVPVLMLLMGFGTLFEMYLVSQTKTAVSAFSREVLIRIVNLILVGLVAIDLLTFREFIIASIIAYVLPASLLIYVSSRTAGFGFSLNWKVFERHEHKEIVKFAWYHLLLGVSLNIMGYLDILMLTTLGERGMEMAAPYRIGVFIVSVGIIPYRAMSTSSVATINQAYIDDDKLLLKDLFQRAGTNILIVSLAVFLLILCNLDNAVAILPRGYEVVKPVVMILVLGRLFDVLTGVNGEVINLSIYYRFNFFISAFLVVVLFTFNTIFIPTWGIYGAAWSTAITLALFNLAKTFFLWQKMGLHMINKQNMKILLAFILAGVVGYNFPVLVDISGHIITTSLIDSIVRSLLILLVYFLLLIWFKPSEDLEKYIESVKATRKFF